MKLDRLFIPMFKELERIGKNNTNKLNIKDMTRKEEMSKAARCLKKAQKEWFKTKSRVAIVRSKVLEKKIDQEIERVEALMNHQPNENQLKLFDNEQQTEDR